MQHMLHGIFCDLPIIIILARAALIAMRRIAAMKLCRACGVDVSKDTKNRHPLIGKDICPTLAEFATSAVKSLPSPSGCELCLDVKKFEAGYVCQ